MEQPSLHRGISSICVLTWDVRNVRQSQQLCACQGRWQGGAGGQAIQAFLDPRNHQAAAVLSL